jgi:exopolyphosphatase/guanosine-5'-triphosphate,3'-diphosphate pyrophosphatase
VGAIATGGNIETLADLAGVSRVANGATVLPVEDLRRVLNRLTRLKVRDRVKKLGLRADRADVIVPAAVVYERVAVLAGADEILVPRVGLKEGLLLDLTDALQNRRAHSDRHDRELCAAAVSLGRRFQFDEAHARQVAKLALDLFDQLARLHGLGAKERRLLLAGALLHDIGQYVSYQRHHKHSQYLIASSELPGVSPDDLRIVALLARYHRRAEPRDSHFGYQDLGATGREVVRKLSALLRVADALDREHLARVSTLVAKIGGNVVTIRLEIRGSVALEEWALWRKGSMFQRVYGKALRLEPPKRGATATS